MDKITFASFDLEDTASVVVRRGEMDTGTRRVYKNVSKASRYRLARVCRLGKGIVLPYGDGWTWSR